MRLIEITNQNYSETINDILTNKKETIVYGISNDFVILKGNNAINEDYCKKNGLKIYYSSNMGGCIVIGNGDVEFNIYRYDGWQDAGTYSKKILAFLKTKIPNIELDGNDFLIDGKYKVASFSSVNVGDDFIYTAFHFSVNVNIEHIKNICLKPMTKIPKGLSEYSVTSKDIIDFVRIEGQKVL